MSEIENLGKLISDTIDEAVDSMDFQGLSEKLKNSVDKAFSTFKSYSKKDLPATRDPAVCAQKLPEKGKSVAYKCLTIFMAFMTLGCFAGILDAYGFLEILGRTLATAGCGSASIFSRRRAKKIDTISSHYIRFLRELGPNSVISVRDLASSVAQSEEETIKDLLYLMNNGYFRQARIVENDQIFLLDIPTFKLYKERLKERPQEYVEEEKVENINLEERADLIIQDGNKNLEEIGKIKAKIQNPDFLSKIGRLEKNVGQILWIVKKYPDKVYLLDKFSTYYLPTTEKLIEAYLEFEAMRSDDKKIRRSMEEIDKSLDTINEAFEAIQVQMLTDRAMDVKTDIDTLNLLLSQEGLVDSEFGGENE